MSIPNTFSGKPPSDYEEVLDWRIAQRTSRILVMNLLSIPLAFVFGIVFLIFVLMFGKPSEILSTDSTKTAILLVGILPVVVMHELAHGVAMQTFGAQPKYGVIWKGLMFYATAPGYAFQRNQYIVISLAPLVSLSILACFGILIQAGTFNVWLWAVWSTINGGAAIGDLWITAIALRYPKHAYIIDERDGIRVFLPQSEGRMK
jgi:Putative zincin peptidase